MANPSTVGLPEPSQLPTATVSAEFSDAGNAFREVIALVDAHALSRSFLVQSLNSSFAQEMDIRPFSTAEDARSCTSVRIRLIVLCTHQQTEQLVKAATETVQGTNVPLLVVTDERLSDLQPFFREMLHSGVCGFVSTIDTEFRTLVAAIEFILNGGVFVPPEFFTQGPPYTDESKKSQRALDKLTKRQIDVFTKLREGKENKQIASELGMSASTVKSHVRDIMRTMGARNRTEAVVKARSGRIPER